MLWRNWATGRMPAPTRHQAERQPAMGRPRAEARSERRVITMRKLFAVILLATLSGGCMMGPDYRRPALDIPNSFQYETKDALDTANTEWWRNFQDPVLDGLIAEALANNKN